MRTFVLLTLWCESAVQPWFSVMKTLKSQLRTMEIPHGAAHALERILLRYDTNPCTGMYIRSISRTAFVAFAYLLVAAELLKKQLRV